MADVLPNENIRTRALVVDKPGAPFTFQDVILNDIRERELLVEIKYTGLCHTDLMVQAGKMPMGSFPAILGHEGAGIVRRLGTGLEDAGLSLGDRVLLGFSSCLQCSACGAGRKGACSNIAMTNFVGTRGPGDESIRLADGRPVLGSFFGQSSFSQLAIVDFRSVVKYDGPVDDLAILAPLGCGYMAGAGSVLNVLKPKPENTIAIIGLGAVGLAALMAARYLNMKTILAVDMIDSRLQLAAELGATAQINSTRYDSVEHAFHTVLPEGVDVVVDTTGSPKVLSSAVKGLAHGGTLAIVGTPPPGENLQIEAMDMLVHCKTIMGITGGYCNPQKFIPKLVDMFRSGVFPIDRLHKLYPAKEVETAIAEIKSGKVVKPVLTW